MSNYIPEIGEERARQVKRLIGSGCPDCDLKNDDLCDTHLYKFANVLKYITANIPFHDVSVIMEERLVDKIVQEVENLDRPVPTLSRGFPVYDRILKRYIAKLDTDVLTNGYSFIFYGYNGSGKTQTANHILALALDKGMSGYYIFFKELMILYNKAEFEHDKDADKLYQYMMNTDLLVIDEVGKESSVTENLLGTFEQIIKYRTGLGKPTIMLMNIDFPKVDVGFKARYKNSIYNALLKHYRVLRFHEDGEFRIKTRKEWSL